MDLANLELIFRQILTVEDHLSLTLDFLHQTALPHYWLLLTPTHLRHFITHFAFVLINILFHSLIRMLFCPKHFPLESLSILPPLPSLDSVIILFNRHLCIAPAILSLHYLTSFHSDILLGSTLHLNSISFRQFSRSNIFRHVRQMNLR